VADRSEEMIRSSTGFEKSIVSLPVKSLEVLSERITVVDEGVALNSNRGVRRVIGVLYVIESALVIKPVSFAPKLLMVNVVFASEGKLSSAAK
jgi:hypothetical protein